MSNTPRATKKQQELLEFVTNFIREHDYGPSYREIMTGLGYKSVSTVAVHVEALIAKGFLERRDNSPRSLSVVRSLNALREVASAKDGIEHKITMKIDELLPLDRENAQILIRTLHILGYDTAAEKYTRIIEREE